MSGPRDVCPRTAKLWIHLETSLFDAPAARIVGFSLSGRVVSPPGRARHSRPRPHFISSSDPVGRAGQRRASGARR
jgi:hypothetical protein